MKTIQTFTENKESINIFLDISDLVSSIKDKDEKIRVLAVALSNAIEDQWKDMGIKYKEGKARKLLFHMGGGYKLKCFDHYGAWDYKEVKGATVEPYSLSLADLKDIVAFCEKENVQVHIDGESPHFPGRTIMIRFY